MIEPGTQMNEGDVPHNHFYKLWGRLFKNIGATTTIPVDENGNQDGPAESIHPFDQVTYVGPTPKA